MYYFDTKITIWERAHFESEAQMLEAKALLESGVLKTGLDVTDHFELSTDVLFETSEEVYPEENNFFRTLEIRSDDKVFWHNGKEKLEMLNSKDDEDYICGLLFGVDNNQ